MKTGWKSESGFPRVRGRAKDRLSHVVSFHDTVWLGRRWRYQRQRRPLDLLIEPAEFGTWIRRRQGSVAGTVNARRSSTIGIERTGAQNQTSATRLTRVDPQAPLRRVVLQDHRGQFEQPSQRRVCRGATADVVRLTAKASAGGRARAQWSKPVGPTPGVPFAGSRATRASARSGNAGRANLPLERVTCPSQSLRRAARRSSAGWTGRDQSNEKIN